VSRAVRIWGAISALALLAGCGADGGGGAEGAFLDDLPRLALVETARIGSTEDPDYGFSRVGQVQVGPDGNVWVAEAQDLELRVYTPEGERLRSMGRRGEGPGEFERSLDRFGFVGDTVWTWEEWPRRLGLFTLEGRVLATVRVELAEAELFASGEMSRLGPGYVDADGFLVGERGMGMLGQGPPQRDTAHVPLVRFTTAGAVVDTVGAYPAVRRDFPGPITVGRSRHVLPAAPSGEARWIVTGSHLVEVDHDAGDGIGHVRITRLTHVGDTVHTRSYAVRSVPFPEAYLDSIATDRAQQVGPIFTTAPGGAGMEMLERHPEDSAAARAAIRRQMPFPALQPPVQAHHVGADEALWLRREETGGGTRTWVVFGSEDRPRGVVEVPRSVRIAWSDGDETWAVEPDEFGVPWIVRYRLVPEG
jgi:hypothetical protein